jgi:hypothetical protein
MACALDALAKSRHFPESLILGNSLGKVDERIGLSVGGVLTDPP